MTRSTSCKAKLAPLRGAVNLRNVPVVCASLRPPATFVPTLRVDGPIVQIDEKSGTSLRRPTTSFYSNPSDE
jgi:hypothetical protein